MPVACHVLPTIIVVDGGGGGVGWCDFGILRAHVLTPYQIVNDVKLVIRRIFRVDSFVQFFAHVLLQ